MADGKLLNEKQQEAITFGEGPLLIIAGAGTGKTTVVTKRITHLLLEKHVSSNNILALTFTEKAAKEMEERVDIEMPYGYTQLWIATFHAFCDRILRNEAIHIGLDPAYRLMTEAESILFLREHIFDLQLDYFRPLGNPNKFLEGLLQHFSRLKDEDISPTEYMEWAQIKNSERRTQNENEEDEIKKTKELANAFNVYEELKAKEGVMDFSDLIGNTLKLFRTRKNILATYQEQFHYVLVDEFQDTNYAQNMLAIMLAGERQNITVVGDDDQAIYRWRGAAISNMIQFRTHFPKAKIITLTKNYRSTQEILDRSYQVITNNNPDRLEVKENIDKKLQAERREKSHPLQLIYEERVEDEAESVVKKINEMVEKKLYAYKDFAILIRANDYAVPFTKAFERQGIPYQFLGPGRLFLQEEIKDLIAYLKVLYNFDDSISLYRVLAMPIWQVSGRTLGSILNLAKRKNLSLFASLDAMANEGSEFSLFIPNDEKQRLIKITQLVKKHLEKVTTESAGHILYDFLQSSGMLKTFLGATSDDNIRQSKNIAKFFDKLKSFEAEHEDARILPVVEWIDLAMQMGESPLANDTDWTDNNAVNLLTIHASKGLEFPVVFLVNLVSQRFPTRERREQIPIPQDLIKEILPEGDYHLQEERRLFYVAMTRAKDRLFLTAAKYYGEGKRDRKLSPFVYEALPEEAIAIMLKKQTTGHIVQPSLLDLVEEMESAAKNAEQVQLKMTIPPITYVSYSQLQTFDICPLHYKLQYILKVPSPPSPPLSFGISIHAALRDFYQAFRTIPTLTPQDSIPMLEKVWIDEGYASKKHEQEALERAKTVLIKYLSQALQKNQRQIAATEIPFSFFVSKPEIRKTGVKVGGRIDRVDILDNNRIEIIDYKTGNNPPSEKELLTNLQLTLYALAAVEIQEGIFHKKPEEITLSLHYVESNQILTTTRTKEQLEEAKVTVLQKIQEIEKSDFACSHSIFCRNCEYKMLCETRA